MGRFSLLFRFKLPIASMLVALLYSCSDAPLSEHDSASGTYAFNHGWQFFRSTDDAPDLNPKDQAAELWQPVSLPHTPLLEPKIVNNQWQGDAWYRKSFVTEPEWEGQRIWLRFEAAMNRSEVWLNDQQLYTHQGGYLPFTLDITDALVDQGANRLMVVLDNRDNPVTGPKPLSILDFNMYGGLYRNVHLIVKNPLHISDEIMAGKVAGGGVFVSYPRVTEQLAEVAVATDIENMSTESETVQVVQNLYSIPENDLIATNKSTARTLASGQSYQFKQGFELVNPQLWSPSEPYLHRLETLVYSGEQLVDQRGTSIGIREFRFNRDNELLINGKKTFLRGVNRHQEYPYVGYALSDNAQYRDAVKIKEAGFDYVRLSHYPHSPAFMAAADELGLVVLDAILGWQYYSEDSAFREQIVQSCRDLIRRDRNHASVLAWECSLNESGMPEEFVDQLHAAVHQEYPGPTTYSAGWMNYAYDIFLQARQHRIEHYEKPTKPYMVSEYGDWEYYAKNAGLNQDGWGDLLQQERSSRQLLSDGETRLLQQATNVQEAHNDNRNVPAFADGYWVMFDYNRGYADDLEASGVMSIDRLPKYSYYFFRSQRDASDVSDKFSSGPMVFIASRWDAQSSSDVRLYSNCEQTELFLNGVSLGRQDPDQTLITSNLNHPPFTFAIAEFEPGTLDAQAFCNGELSATHSVSTPGDPSTFDLVIDEAGVPAELGVNDLLFVHARFVDKNGTLVPLSGEQVQAVVIGDIEILNVGPLVSEAGITSFLVRIGSSLEGASLQVWSDRLGLDRRSIEFVYRPN